MPGKPKFLRDVYTREMSSASYLSGGSIFQFNPLSLDRSVAADNASRNL